MENTISTLGLSQDQALAIINEEIEEGRFHYNRNGIKLDRMEAAIANDHPGTHYGIQARVFVQYQGEYIGLFEKFFSKKAIAAMIAAF